MTHSYSLLVSLPSSRVLGTLISNPHSHSFAIADLMVFGEESIFLARVDMEGKHLFVCWFLKYQIHVRTAVSCMDFPSSNAAGKTPKDPGFNVFCISHLVIVTLFVVFFCPKRLKILVVEALLLLFCVI